MAPRRRPRPAAASRILAAGVAVGTAGGAVAFMAVNDPRAPGRAVASPAPSAPLVGPVKVIVFEVLHRPAPVTPSATDATVAGEVGGAVPRAAAPPNAATPPPATRAATASAPASAPAPAPAPATKTGPS